MKYYHIEESVDIDTDLIAALALKKYPNEFPSDNEIEEIICDKYKAILPSNYYRLRCGEVRNAIWEVCEKIADNYEVLDEYQIKDVLDNSLYLKYSRRYTTSYREFYLSSEKCEGLGYIYNQDVGSYPDNNETFYAFYRPMGDESDEVRRQIADLMEASGMKELKASNHITRLFKVKNLDDLSYIINGLEYIIENYE